LAATAHSPLGAAQPDPDVITIGPLEILPSEHLARVGGRTLLLSTRELRLLTELAKHADRIVSREHLCRLAWDRELRAGDRSVDVYVRRLRVKLERAMPGWRFIHTHFGFGYRLAPEYSRSADQHNTRSADQHNTDQAFTPE
jgi:DNA-binding response OmpR family regulator